MTRREGDVGGALLIERQRAGGIVERHGAAPEGVVGDVGPERLHRLARREVRGDMGFRIHLPSRPVLRHRERQALVVVGVPAAVVADAAGAAGRVEVLGVAHGRRDVEPGGGAAPPLRLPSGPAACRVGAGGLQPVGVRVEVLDLVEAHPDDRVEHLRVVLVAGLPGDPPHVALQAQPLGRDRGRVREAALGLVEVGTVSGLDHVVRPVLPPEDRAAHDDLEVARMPGERGGFGVLVEVDHPVGDLGDLDRLLAEPLAREGITGDVEMRAGVVARGGRRAPARQRVRRNAPGAAAGGSLGC